MNGFSPISVVKNNNGNGNHNNSNHNGNHNNGKDHHKANPSSTIDAEKSWATKELIDIGANISKKDIVLFIKELSEKTTPMNDVLMKLFMNDFYRVAKDLDWRKDQPTIRFLQKTFPRDKNLQHIFFQKIY